VLNWHCISGTVLVPTGVNLIGRTETLIDKGSITSGRCAGKPATAAGLTARDFDWHCITDNK
jgi:hypothetical protein